MTRSQWEWDQRDGQTIVMLAIVLMAVVTLGVYVLAREIPREANDGYAKTST